MAADSLMLEFLFVLFAIGLLWVGAIIVGEYQSLRTALLNYSNNVKEYREGKMTYPQVAAVFEQDTSRMMRISRVNKVFGYSSFGAFVVGTLLACAWLFVAGDRNGAGVGPC